MNHSFLKRPFKATKVVAQIISSQNIETSISRPYSKMISIPFRLKKPCPDSQNHSNFEQKLNIRLKSTQTFLKTCKNRLSRMIEPMIERMTERMTERASERVIDGDRKSSSRSPFDTLTGAMCSIFQNYSF